MPRKLTDLLNSMGFDAIHTLDLKLKNRTTDSEICEISIQQSRIVISKDVDFFNLYLQKSEPYKLIFLTVGNLSTSQLLDLFRVCWESHKKL